MIAHQSPGQSLTQTAKRIRSLIRQGAIVLAGNKKLKIYGTLRCVSGKRMLPANRVFFASEQEAIAAGFRPCGHCLREKYLAWKNPVQPPPPRPTSFLPMEKPPIFPEFFSKDSADRQFDRLLREIPWQHQPIKIFGRTVLQPRLTAWYGDTAKPIVIPASPSNPFRGRTP